MDRKPENDKYECGQYYKESIPKPEQLKHTTRDYYRYGLPFEMVKQRLEQFPVPDIIFLNSMMTYWYPSVLDMAVLCREKFQETPIVLGGIYATLMPEHAKTNINPDFLLTKDNEIKTKGLKLKISDFLYEKQDRYLLSNKKTHILITGYGCPYECDYCASKCLFDGFQQREVDDVLYEIQAADKNGTKHFVFYDDALFVNKEKHIKPILRQVIEKGIKTNFHTPNGLHAKLIDKELAELMFKAGFKTIRLSLETTDEVLQQEKSKKVNCDEFKTAVYNLKQAGFKGEAIETYIMMGLIGQSKGQLYKDIMWVHKCGASIVLASYSPVFGTKDYERLANQEIIKKDEDPLLLNNTIFIYNTGYTLEEIRKIRKTVSVLNYAIKQEVCIAMLTF